MCCAITQICYDTNLYLIRTASQRKSVNRTSFDVLLDTIAPESAAPPLLHRFTAITNSQ